MHKMWVEEEFAKGEFSKLIVISDNCGGQNKNINVILRYLYQIHSRRLQYFDHYNLVPGHMACDRAFGVIEKAIRAEGEIYDVDHYCTVIRDAVHKKKIVTKSAEGRLSTF